MNTLLSLLMSLTFAPAQNDDYVFLPMKYKEVKLYVLDDKSMLVLTGYLNRYGTFVSESIEFKQDNRKSEGAKNFAGPAPRSTRSVDSRRKPMSHDCFNHPAFGNEPVYEYRSGKLLPGYLGPNCDFIPEADELIIDFKDFVYSSTSRRIYNLPGKFVKKSQLKEEQAKITELESRKP